MAWCQEFGVQIHEGCDHLMAADIGSCSCADCGVICLGKFPACAAVWAAGSVAVSLRDPPRQLKALPALPPPPDLALGNGWPVTRPDDAGDDIVGDDDPDVAAVLRSMRSEIQGLSLKVDGLQTRAEIADQMAEGAAQSAVEQQAAPLLAHLDGRLEWLVNELSHRLVILGNEVVRINTLLATAADDALHDNQAGHKRSGRRQPATTYLLHEKDRGRTSSSM